MDGAYFEGLYRADPDPWGFATRPYEREKYDHTMSALGGERAHGGLEVGCAIGVLTRRLARLCDRLLAVDISQTALESAQRRCADLSNVDLQLMSLPAQTPDGAFDLVVLSEVVYYWDAQDVALMGAVLTEKVTPGGRVLLVHWTGETDYPQTADAAVSHLAKAAGPSFSVELAQRADQYRLDLWRRLG